MLHHPVAVSPQKRAKKDLIGSVQRALRIMELLARYPEGLNSKQIGLKLQLNLSTCYHLLNTLEYAGYLIKDPNTQLFRLSGKIGYTAFAQASPAQLVKQLAPHVQNLQEIPVKRPTCLFGTVRTSLYPTLWKRPKPYG